MALKLHLSDLLLVETARPLLAAAQRSARATLLALQTGKRCPDLHVRPGYCRELRDRQQADGFTVYFRQLFYNSSGEGIIASMNNIIFKNMTSKPAHLVSPAVRRRRVVRPAATGCSTESPPPHLAWPRSPGIL